MAGRLSQRKLDNILSTGAEWSITANAGCLLQIAREARAQGEQAVGRPPDGSARPELPERAADACSDVPALRLLARAYAASGGFAGEAFGEGFDFERHQALHQFAGRGAAQRFLGQHLLHQPRGARRHVRHRQRTSPGSSWRCCMASSATSSASNGKPAGEHLEQHHAQAVDVALQIAAGATSTAARGPCSGSCPPAADRQSCRLLVAVPGKRQVDQRGVARGRDDDVAGLDVAVHPAGRVRARPAPRPLAARSRNDAADRAAGRARQLLGQRMAFQQRHRQVVGGLVKLRRQHRHQVRMRRPGGRRASRAPEAPARARSSCHSSRRHLIA